MNGGRLDKIRIEQFSSGHSIVSIAREENRYILVCNINTNIKESRFENFSIS